MKLKTFFLIFCFLSINSFADWKKDIFNYFDKIKDYEGAINYLVKRYSTEESKNKKYYCILLCYSFNKFNDRDNEIMWIKEYFEKYRGEETTINFLDDTVNFDISDYIMSWKKKYPLITQIQLLNIDEYNYSNKPDKIQLKLYVSNVAYFKLSKNNKTVEAGLLNKGKNELNINTKFFYEREKKHIYVLELSVGRIKIKKEVIIDVEIKTPESIEIKDGKIHFKNKSFKNEYQEEISFEKIKYFDKKYFFRKSIFNTGIGLTVFAGNHLVFHNKLNDTNYSMRAEPIYYGTYNCLKAVSIGFVLKGIFKFIKSFKVKINEKRKRIYSKSAATYNEFLRKTLLEAEKEISVTFKLTIRNIM